MQKLDIDHVLFWMDAIRNSKEPHRTLESFWKGQIKSKLWLIKNLRKHVDKVVSIDIHGGWNGVLASMIFQSTIYTKQIRSLDIDPSCEETANTINKLEEMSGKFKAITADMCDTKSTADVIINTSCEHITQEQYDKWLSNQPETSLLVLQSNNYDIPEHIRLVNSLEEFEKQSNIKVIWSGEFKLPLYTRYMIIGKK
jgi:hypothetical protein